MNHSQKPRRQERQKPRLGLIRGDEIYLAAEFSERLRLGRWGIREMRKAGLRVLKFHGKVFVDGADFLKFIREKGRMDDKD